MTDHAKLSPHFIADHPALDLLNTVAVLNGAPTDFLQSDADVMAWLERAGFVPEGLSDGEPVARLLDVARGFRELLRNLIGQRKAGEALNLGPLNAYLAQA